MLRNLTYWPIHIGYKVKWKLENLYIKYMRANGHIDPILFILTQGYTIIRKTFCLSFNNIQLCLKLTDIFGRKSAISTGVHIFGICGTVQAWVLFKFFFYNFPIYIFMGVFCECCVMKEPSQVSTNIYITQSTLFLVQL